MKTKLVMLMLAATLAKTAHASKTVLPDACGSDAIRFEVDTKKDQPPPAPPSDGNAQIVFIQTVIRPHFWVGNAGYTTRYGVDGKWVGATGDNTYFVVNVPAGAHHLCYSVHGSKDKVGTASFKAEAGMTYYFEFKVETQRVGQGGIIDTSFRRVDEDEGQFRVKASKLSVPTIQKPDE